MADAMPLGEKRRRLEDEVDTAYFEKYDSAFVHEEMLRDGVRCKAYADAIAACQAITGGGVVIEVGAGSGILSCLCAKAGARKVYAVEASAPTAKLCREVVRANKCEDVVEVLEMRLEDVELPEGVRVDAIVSEWMGYFLFYESMLDSVIFARDRWLKPGGCLLPSRAKLFLQPFSDARWRDLRAKHLSDVCGIDVSPLAARLAAEEASEPAIQGIESEHLFGEPRQILDMDLATVSLAEFSSSIQLPMAIWERPRLVHSSSNGQSMPVHGFAGWFEVTFNPPAPPAWSLAQLLGAPSLAARFAAPSTGPSEAPSEAHVVPRRVVLSTAPGQPRTCWHQTLFYLPSGALEVSSSDQLEAEVSLNRPAENRRWLSVSIRWTHVTPAGAKVSKPAVSWLLRSYAEAATRAPPLPVPRLRGTSRAACYGGAC
ncbi:unnamed protein product [Polarella glacialis]|uniref:Protein arginine N-methyltransferase n=1 Tax=Polarella glacialis TaxID=89957 RepID=A0A813KJF1_POLGL|nr:unnamed protein product [Polarella glacialis]